MTDWAAVIDATWPAAARRSHGPWTIRTGAGGGNRVSAATAVAAVGLDDLDSAVSAMRDLGQEPLFMVRDGEDALDRMLADAGYIIRDPTVIRACPTASLTTEPVPPVTAFTVWPPLAAQRDIWADGGIGPARLAIMDRVQGTKTTLFGRIDDRPAGTLFVAIHDGTAMLHGLEVATHHRRKGLARHLTRAAAFWAQRQGAAEFSLLVTAANAGANALYADLGLAEVGRYHYRALPKEKS
ncbi:GNAT family N-acetyltransferase [Loktanella sp. M215]|uniref:GNAT family N-acetyltransferase n=1 Tax=Loktanella sp. M215 TaxID=2675431 RepID=UPI001F1A01F2|nr:GNAT family N-acetyltransferase [Loktanella sp. M215]MCF7701299.1 GNAT family N-acetyltransferase [Loktanella sp. M215]